MLLQMALILAVMGTVTEVLLVHKIKYVDKLYHEGSNLFWYHKWHVEGMVWNTIGSFVLSYAQGKMFGATGLVIAMSGAISTGLSQIYFAAEAWVQKEYGYETIHKWIKASAPNVKSELANLWQLAKDVWHVIYIVLKVITFPFWMFRAGKQYYRNTIQPLIPTRGVT
jgi:hypothetical protein